MSVIIREETKKAKQQISNKREGISVVDILESIATEEKGFDKRRIYDQVNVRLPAELNDWLNDVVRRTKRSHGAKVPKESLIEASVEFIKELNINWEGIKNKEDILELLRSSVKIHK